MGKLCFGRRKFLFTHVKIFTKGVKLTISWGYEAPCFMVNFPWEGCNVIPSPKIVINLPRTYEKLLCKGEPHRSAVSEILRYKQTDSQTNILLLYHKDINFLIKCLFVSRCRNNSWKADNHLRRFRIRKGKIWQLKYFIKKITLI